MFFFLMATLENFLKVLIKNFYEIYPLSIEVYIFNSIKNALYRFSDMLETVDN